MKLRLAEKKSPQGQATRLVEACSYIRELVVDDRIEEALNHLREVAESQGSHCANEILDLVRQVRSVERSELSGTTTREAAMAEKSRITRFLLKLTDELDYQRKARSVAVELSPAELRARTNYLQVLRRDVQNRLDVSIHKARFIDLGIGDTPSATHLPWVFKDPESLQEFNNIRDAFIKYKRRLLLLGAPGSGKTVTLLHIAEQLISEAEENPAAPIPLLINLSKFQLRQPDTFAFKLWGSKESAVGKRDDRVERWLVGELAVYPIISAEIARKWIEEGRIAALLDGLDEVNDEYRAELVRVLNATYLRDHLESPVVVCSRINEYRPLQDRKETRVQLEGGITLQPLNKTQIADYLKEAKATGLSQALLGDETLAQMAQTPLTLSMMTLAYGGVAPADIPSFSSLTEQRHHLMEAYVERMLQRKEQRDRPDHGDEEVPEEEYAYKPEKINSYLGWLAVRLSVRMQTAFSTHGLFSFLTREIDRDRQSGVWWATVLCRAPVIFLIAMLAGVAVAPMSSEAGLKVLYAGLLGAAVYVPAAWALRSQNEMPSILKNAKLVLSFTIVSVVILGGLSVVSQMLSLILPFGIPPLPAGLIAVCLAIIGLFAAADISSEDKVKRFVIIGSTLAAFFAGMLGMRSSFGSQYGWYIPAVSMAAGLVVSAVIFLAAEGEWGAAAALLLFAVGSIFALAGSVWLIGQLDWYKSLMTFLGMSVIILCATQKPVLMLATFLASFGIGAWVIRFSFPLGESAGSVLGVTIYGYLLLLNFVYFESHDEQSELQSRFANFIQYTVEKVEKLADQYLLSPILLRVVVITRCLPLRYQPFFEYTERSLLLKRSAGDIEFMHRLLRDYFALRDLQPLLKTTDCNRRLEAIQSLGFQGDAAIDALAEFVRSQNPDIREAAASAFGRIASPEVVPHIEAAIKDTEASVRRAAVLSSKNLTENEFMRLISMVIQDDDPSVQRAWLETSLSLHARFDLYSYRLSKEGNEFAKRMHAAVESRDELRQILFHLVETHTNARLRSTALELIEPLKDRRSVPALISALLDRSFVNRTGVAYMLGNLRDPRAVKPLSKVLSVRNKALRSAARAALSMIGTPEALAALRKR
jgi:HEAT repeat protein/DNA polymerase III delta prime subunit